MSVFFFGGGKYNRHAKKKAYPAEKIGTSGPTIGRYERGDMMPSVEIATKIADALDALLDFLEGKSSPAR